MSKNLNQEPTSNSEVLRALPAVTTHELFAGETPPHHDFQGEFQNYTHLADTPLYPFVRTFPTGEKMIMIFTQPLNGEDINDLLYIAAPNKFYGRDTDDILRDWKNLFEDPSNARRLESHRQVPGWSEFEEAREGLRASIQASITTGAGERTPTHQPVLAWKLHQDGHAEWLTQAELSNYCPEKYRGSALPLSAILGQLWVASFSYDITRHWPKRVGYHLEAAIQGAQQSMGATQVLPLVIAKRAEIIGSLYFQRLHDYTNGIIHEQMSDTEKAAFGEPTQASTRQAHFMFDVPQVFLQPGDQIMMSNSNEYQELYASFPSQFEPQTDITTNTYQSFQAMLLGLDSSSDKLKKSITPKLSPQALKYLEAIKKNATDLENILPSTQPSEDESQVNATSEAENIVYAALTNQLTNQDIVEVNTQIPDYQQQHQVQETLATIIQANNITQEWHLMMSIAPELIATVGILAMVRFLTDWKKHNKKNQ